jgi:hypothetical protein
MWNGSLDTALIASKKLDLSSRLPTHWAAMWL